MEFLPTLSQSHGQSSEILLGCMLALYGLYGLCVKKLPHLGKHERWLSPLLDISAGSDCSNRRHYYSYCAVFASLHLKR